MSSIINHTINLSSYLSTFEVCNRGWSSQCKLVITSAIINAFNTIWFCRNNSRFKNIKPSLITSFATITAKVSMNGNLTKLATNRSIVDFVILKAFNVDCHPPKAPRIIEVLWHHPSPSWIKCNTDGTAIGAPGPSACVGIFRNKNGHCLGCFAVSTGISNSLHAEIMGVILAVECASQRN
jgi:hypothetical protein